MSNKTNSLTFKFSKILLALAPNLIFRIGSLFIAGEPDIPKSYDVH